MRLIDADELKKAITEATYNFEQIPIRVDKVQEIIDNAPTVEQKYYERVIAQINPVIEARPQGEWIEVTKGIDSNTYKCPFCGRLINCDKPRLKLYPFCHCGALMMKGGAE